MAPLELLLPVWAGISVALGAAVVTGAWLISRRRTKPGRKGLASAENFEVRNAKVELLADSEPFAVIDGRPIHEAAEDTAWVLAPSGQGKTVRALVRWIARAGRGPVVATSTKPDVVRLTARLRAEFGRIWVFDPQGVMTWPEFAPAMLPGPQGPTRAQWDLVAGCELDEEALARAKGVVAPAMPSGDGESSNSKFFRVGVTTILRCYLHAAALEGRSMRDVLAWSRRFTDNTPYDILYSHQDAKPGWYDDLVKYTRGEAQQTIDNMAQTLASVLEPFSIERILESVCPGPGAGFSVDEFLASSDTIYLLTPSGGSALGAPVITALVDTIQRAALERATKLRSGRLDPRLTNALDEVPNVCPIPCLPSVMSDGRGHGIRTMGVAQDRPQLIQQFGRNQANTIIGQASFLVQLGGSTDVEHLRELSALAGRREVDRTSTTTHQQGASSTTATQMEDRLPVDEIRELPMGQALLMYRELPVAVAYLPAYWETKRKSDYEASVAWVLHYEGHGA
ncbi:type IV secretory system conjugative DNA transfer family protein [Agromyces sp. Soil535]|uniref:type IV secretory system conjugative DNA transfer family protein n=1 Tax=Agromyces sp. Soil535 TaxID=1736390 RepID=UPI00138EE9C8|nr:TraM recognition domain-containing protein [Agromyces sp. Soil535]